MDIASLDGLKRSSEQETVHARLRRLTRADHERVDRAFGRFDLAVPRDYGAFLTAHGRVLPDLERRLIAAGLLDPATARTGALAADLAALGLALPHPAILDLPSAPGASWGALYVVEGSRLGGVMLARSVSSGMPLAYLGAGHHSGGWRRVLAGIEAAADGPAWLDDAVVGAQTVFAAYERAADEDLGHG